MHGLLLGSADLAAHYDMACCFTRLYGVQVVPHNTKSAMVHVTRAQPGYSDIDRNVKTIPVHLHQHCVCVWYAVALVTLMKPYQHDLQTIMPSPRPLQSIAYLRAQRPTTSEDTRDVTLPLIGLHQAAQRIASALPTRTAGWCQQLVLHFTRRQVCRNRRIAKG